MRLLIVLLALSACSRTVKEAATLDQREVAKLAAQEALKKSETLETASREVKRKGPVTTVIEEFGPSEFLAQKDVVAAAGVQPALKGDQPPTLIGLRGPPILLKRTTIRQGPVEDVKDATSKAKLDTSDKTKIAAEKEIDTHAKKATEKDTDVGPPRWMIGLAICLVVLIVAIAGVIYLRRVLP